MVSQDDDQWTYLFLPLNPILIDDRSERSFRSPELSKRLPYIQLLLPPTDKFYPIFNALIKDVNKTTSR